MSEYKEITGLTIFVFLLCTIALGIWLTSVVIQDREYNNYKKVSFTYYLPVGIFLLVGMAIFAIISFGLFRSSITIIDTFSLEPRQSTANTTAVDPTWDIEIKGSQGVDNGNPIVVDIEVTTDNTDSSFSFDASAKPIELYPEIKLNNNNANDVPSRILFAIQDTSQSIDTQGTQKSISLRN